MTDDSYSYSERKGALPISWQDFHALTKGLAAAVAPYQPEWILGIARGGLYPAALLAQLLRVELFPIRLTRRVRDEVVRTSPEWLIPPPEMVRGRRVLVVDEICDSGETLRLAAGQTRQSGAAEVRTAVLYAHRRAEDVPDYIGLITDQLLVNPWDREVFQDGRFVFHPEYAAALAGQGLTVTDEFSTGIPPRPPDRAWQGR